MGSKYLHYKKNKLFGLSWSKWYLGFYLNLPFHKGLEVELSLSELWDLFNIQTKSELKGDHASLMYIDIVVLWFNFEFNLYDGRHWNYDENRFYRPDDERHYD